MMTKGDDGGDCRTGKPAQGQCRGPKAGRGTMFSRVGFGLSGRGPSSLTVSLRGVERNAVPAQPLRPRRRSRCRNRRQLGTPRLAEPDTRVAERRKRRSRRRRPRRPLTSWIRAMRVVRMRPRRTDSARVRVATPEVGPRRPGARARGLRTDTGRDERACAMHVRIEHEAQAGCPDSAAVPQKKMPPPTGSSEMQPARDAQREPVARRRDDPSASRPMPPGRFRQPGCMRHLSRIRGGRKKRTCGCRAPRRADCAVRIRRSDTGGPRCRRRS